MRSSRKHLSAQGLFGLIHSHFKTIKSPRVLSPRSKLISVSDCLMSGLAMFSLKFPSLLKFDEAKEEPQIKHNLRTLFQVKQAPSDTYMRERNDEVDPREIRKVYKKVFSQVQRGGGLEVFEYLDKHYLLAGDGTGFFSSDTVHCDHCCVKHNNKHHLEFVTTLSDRLSDYKKHTYVFVKAIMQPWELYYVDGERRITTRLIDSVAGLPAILADHSWKSLPVKAKEQIRVIISIQHKATYPEEKVTYYHNMFCAAIVHPDTKIVLPIAPEPIMKTDGVDKNDCERRASQRLYTDIRREHPHLKLIVVEDSIASNVLHLSDLQALNMRYIVGAKQGDHKFLFHEAYQVDAAKYEHRTDDGKLHRYRYINQIQLNKKHANFKTNFIEYWETDKNGNRQHFSWVTDIHITNENIFHIMRGGRSNWRIENNTFNTLKNQNYHFAHNFGHGYQHLSTVFGMLMLLAFFVDQVQELSCHLFKKARTKFNSRTSLWEKMRGMFREYLINSWDDLFNAITHGYDGAQLVPNTS